MAEAPRQLTQAEVDRILFNQRMNMQPQSIQSLNRNVSGAVTPIPENIFQRMAGGAKAVGDYVNRAGTAADVAKLFPGYTGQSQFNIPTGFNFAPKQSPTGEIIPGGLQTNQVNVNQLLNAIKPADVLGLTGAQQAYTDVGMGRAPKPMDVLDVAGLGAVGLGAGKAATKAGIAAGKYAAPEVGRMAEQYAIQTGLLNPLTAYHGSPYTFDKFDISKVGTGEGAQAYGHGIYFAEAPGVARGYQAALSGYSADGKRLPSNIATVVSNFNGDIDAAIAYRQNQLNNWLDSNPDKKNFVVKDLQNEIKQLSKLQGKKLESTGSFYTVDIPDDMVATMLDWDKPLSKQKDLVAKITPEALGLEYKQLPNGNHAYVNADGRPFWILQKGGTKESFDNRWKESLLMQNSGGELYKALNQGLDDAAKTSAALNKAGIQGIKYLDQSSRADGKGTRNFVVFDPSSVKMLERNNEQVQGLLK